MKGIIIKRTNDRKWVVMYNRVPGSVDILEIHPDDVHDNDLSHGILFEEKEGKEVEFEQVSAWDAKANGYNIFASLILPKKEAIKDYSEDPTFKKRAEEASEFLKAHPFHKEDMDEFNSVGDCSLHPKAPTETWESIIAEANEHYKPTAIHRCSQVLEYLRTNYLPPIKK